ncbi:MAG: hypothetical protein AAF655_20775 [Bacteroidota bacterium]
MMSTLSTLSCTFINMLKSFLAFFSFWLCIHTVYSQVELYDIGWEKQSWFLLSAEETEDYFQASLSKQPNLSNEKAELADIRIIKTYLTLSIDQIMAMHVRDVVRPDHPKAKMTIIEKHSSFQTEFPYVLFTVESQIDQTLGVPRSLLFLIIKGKNQTNIFCRSKPGKKFKGGIEDKWGEIFQAGIFTEVDWKKFLESLPTR